MKEIPINAINHIDFFKYQHNHKSKINHNEGVIYVNQVVLLLAVSRVTDFFLFLWMSSVNDRHSNTV